MFLLSGWCETCCKRYIGLLLKAIKQCQPWLEHARGVYEEALTKWSQNIYIDKLNSKAVLTIESHGCSHPEYLRLIDAETDLNMF